MYMGDTYQNNETYLYNGENWYWTMSSFAFLGDRAGVGNGYQGAIDGSDVDNALGGARPVISLLSSGITGGNGTASAPFIIGSE